MAELSTTQIAAAGMRAQGVRLRHISENIANADTPGYRRKLVEFHPETDFGRATGAVATGPTLNDQRDLPRIYDPGNPLADEAGYFNGSNVDLVIEVADSREAARSYEANLRIFEQSRQMNASLLDILRR